MKKNLKILKLMSAVFCTGMVAGVGGTLASCDLPDLDGLEYDGNHDTIVAVLWNEKPTNSMVKYDTVFEPDRASFKVIYGDRTFEIVDDYDLDVKGQKLRMKDNGVEVTEYDRLLEREMRNCTFTVKGVEIKYQLELRAPGKWPVLSGACACDPIDLYEDGTVGVLNKSSGAVRNKVTVNDAGIPDPEGTRQVSDIGFSAWSFDPDAVLPGETIKGGLKIWMPIWEYPNNKSTMVKTLEWLPLVENAVSKENAPYLEIAQDGGFTIGNYWLSGRWLMNYGFATPVVKAGLGIDEAHPHGTAFPLEQYRSSFPTGLPEHES